jgi:hypothetical protein
MLGELAVAFWPERFLAVDDGAIHDVYAIADVSMISTQ